MGARPALVLAAPLCFGAALFAGAAVFVGAAVFAGAGVFVDVGVLHSPAGPGLVAFRAVCGFALSVVVEADDAGFASEHVHAPHAGVGEAVFDLGEHGSAPFTRFTQVLACGVVLSGMYPFGELHCLGGIHCVV